MGSLVLTGDTSGSGTIAVPTVAGTFTATIGSATGTHYPFTAGTAVASTSGTSIDFTGIPSWVKRITVMFNGVSTSGTSQVQVQTGAGSVTTSGYDSRVFGWTGGTQGAAYTSGFVIETTASAIAAAVRIGSIQLLNVSGNIWVATGVNSSYTTNGENNIVNGNISLSGTLDRVRITTVNGTDTFDAGSINILYE